MNSINQAAKGLMEMQMTFTFYSDNSFIINNLHLASCPLSVKLGGNS